MSQQKDLLRQLAAATNSDAPDRISDWFTEDFVLHEPGQPTLPTGHEGARQMREKGRQKRAGLKRAGVTTPLKLEILDMIEENDRVAVRWQVSGTYDNGNPYGQSILSIYRFEKGRIAEDWGMGIPTLWP
jgi:ketosteroid isomerase-like protein